MINSIIPWRVLLSLKGAPAQESRIGTWLVSPATGCQKKKKTPLEQGLSNKYELYQSSNYSCLSQLFARQMTE